jgi:tRNA threonylcarbamoyladenosine biosynthesis protein TsaB
MKILAVDTATKTCSVAITDSNDILAELTVNHLKTHTAFLMKMIQFVLNAADLLVDHIDGLAVTIGPGSFTGLRIGLSSIKGISAATGKPVVGVSSLETLAHTIPITSKCICPMIDARKGQVYCARFRHQNGLLINELPVRSIKPIHVIESISEPCIFIGDGALAYKDMIADKLGGLAFFARPYQNLIKASVVAQLSLQRFLNGDTDSPESLTPAYARESDAESARQEKQIRSIHPI